jgi:hypothetical protein
MNDFFIFEEGKYLLENVHFTKVDLLIFLVVVVVAA